MLAAFARLLATVSVALTLTVAANVARADVDPVPAAPAGLPVRVTGEQAQQRMAVKGIFVNPTNQRIGLAKEGLFCTGDREIHFSTKVADLVMQSARRIVREELQGAGYLITEPSAFASTDSAAAVEYQLAATLVDLKMNLCLADHRASGGVWVKINWELYSPRERRVMLHAALEGSVQSKDKVDIADLYEAAVRSAARNLLADPEFVAQATQRANGGAAKALDTLAIATRLAGGPGSQARMPELQSSVVTIFSGIGSGSGFYISADGYLLTNQHVVGDAKFVKIKLASGRELLGEVMRSAAERDVALVKTEAVALAPMALAEEEAKPGDEVYALGSPFGDTFSQSVTRGVVSGMREVDKLRWVQSDVTVAPGSSGGPLVNAAGGVIALTRGGVRGANVNIFVPIADAMSTLKIAFRQP